LLTQTLTVEDAAQLLKLSRRTIIRLFEREPGVLVLDRPELLHKRRYRTVRIPRAVFERVTRRLTI
jgi:transcriptional regulator GlxA family with amidase domain